MPSRVWLGWVTGEITGTGLHGTALHWLAVHYVRCAALYLHLNSLARAARKGEAQHGLRRHTRAASTKSLFRCRLARDLRPAGLAGPRCRAGSRRYFPLPRPCPWTAALGAPKPRHATAYTASVSSLYECARAPSVELYTYPIHCFPVKKKQLQPELLSYLPLMFC